MDLIAGLEFLEQNKQQMLDLTIKLAEINSGSFHLAGVQTIANLLNQEFLALGCERIVMPVAPVQFINNRGEPEERPLGPVVRFWKRPQARTQVLFLGHMDTVYGKDHNFQKISRVGGDILHGPGVADMKGGLAILLWTLKTFEQLPFAANLGWEVILTADEELGSPGSKEIIENRAKKHHVGFVFEPAMDEYGTLAGARKGAGNFTLVMHGKAAHAGRHFNEGRNAICKMVEIVDKVNALNGQREGVTLNVGFIHGGEAVNVVPDCCIFKLDVRIPQLADADWVLTTLQEITKEFNKQAGYKLELHGAFDRKPKVFDAKLQKLYHIVQTVGHSLGQSIDVQPSGGCCDGNNLSAVGLPNVDTLGVRGGKIHSEQEYMLIPSLAERACLLTKTLVYLSENGFENGA